MLGYAGIRSTGTQVSGGNFAGKVLQLHQRLVNGVAQVAVHTEGDKKRKNHQQQFKAGGH